MSGLLGEDYSQARCCYDLRRLRLKGLIVRLEHSNTYVLTEDGQRFAVFNTKIHNRLLRPCWLRTNRRHRYRFGRRSKSLTTRSPTTSTKPGSPPEESAQMKTP